MGDTGQVGCNGGFAPTVPGVQGPWGQPVAMAAPYSAVPPGASAAYAMMSRSVPLDAVQMAGAPPSPSGVVQAGASMPADGPSGLMLAGGSCPPGGCPPGGSSPPGAAMSPPGLPFGPGMPGYPPPPPGAVAAVGALTGGVPSRFAVHRTSVRFTAPVG